MFPGFRNALEKKVTRSFSGPKSDVICLLFQSQESLWMLSRTIGIVRSMNGEQLDFVSLRDWLWREQFQQIDCLWRESVNFCTPPLSTNN